MLQACGLLLLATLLGATCIKPAAGNELPSLGDSASGTVAPELEHRLGRAWLTILRARTPTVKDPLINDYLEYHVYNLAQHSQLKDRRLEIVVIRSPALNAFAVPGGIMGINAGLFTYAQTEQEFASVVAHELAHLSQRHYSRGVEKARRDQIPNMAALLASVIIGATVGGDAGIAAMTATQAAMLENRLAFSRQNEQEADRIGVLTMINAGMSPASMASMFERMLAAKRLMGDQPPEFLLTHPITESRVADARSRANNAPASSYEENLEYYLMRSRVELMFAKSGDHAVKRFRRDLDNPDPMLREAAAYGLALAHSAAGQEDRANEALHPLLQRDPNRITYLAGYAEINRHPAQLPKVETLLREHLTLSPDNYVLSYYLARNLTLQKKFAEAEAVLVSLSKTRPTDPVVWYELAEVHGLNGNIIGVHQARGEYFLLTGRPDNAIEQLNFARAKAGNSYQLNAKIDQRLKDVHKYKEALKNF